METIHHHGPVLTIPVGLMPSVMAIPSLATIPGSAAPTPSPHSSGEVPTLASLRELPSKLASPPPQSLPIPTQPTEPPDPYANLDSSELEHFVTPPTSPAPETAPVQGSYFPATSSNIPLASATPPQEAERTQPEIEIEIPDPTPSEPLFSSYPEQTEADPAPSLDKGKGKAFTFPLKSLGLGRAPRSKEEEPTSGHVSPEPGVNTGRRRASTIGGTPPIPILSDRRGSHDETSTSSRALAALYAITPSKSLKHFRRRSASISSQTDLMSWVSRNSGSENSLQHPTFPLEPAHTPESDSTGKTAMPMTSPSSPRPGSFTAPTISPRSSSLRQSDLEDVVYSLSSLGSQPVEVIIANGEAPHPPPRSSSLEFSASRVTFDEKAFPDATVIAVPTTDINSLLSSSLTTTETSGATSADFHSASTSSKEHPLSSASTSLSRSDKSGKEGEAREAKDGLSALRLQRSLEWEAKQTRSRRRLEKRRMILLELVETEVAYTHDLKTLVHVYLPQLFSLPGLSDTSTRAVARNAQELLELHEGFMGRMVMVMKEEEMTVLHEPDMASKLERVARRLALLFVDEVSRFSAYNEYCAGSITAAALVRRISLRPDFDMFERRCQIIAATLPHQTLDDLLLDTGSSSSLPASANVATPPTSPGGTLIPRNRSRLHFRDFLITPIQRVCRYPLLLNQLLGSASSPMPDRDDSSIHMSSEASTESYDVGVDVERALGAMKGVAEEADEARRVRDIEIKTATILDRLEPHPALTSSFLQSLGKCRLVGSLDVLHHHPTLAPLAPPIKVKYLAAFLYKGYLILAKVKKGKTYEVRHYLPLEVFELIDITEGFLPHSVRLSLREHNFDLAASCEAEKEVWSAALNDARESSMPPFELPASVSPFAARKRRMSAVLPFVDHPAPEEPSPDSKRHTILGTTGTTSDFGLVEANPGSTEEAKLYTTPPASPTRSSFGFTPDQAGRPGQPSTILLRRATAPQRLVVDRGLGDIISESCATARSKAQLHQVLFLPDVPLSEIRDRMSIRDSTMVRRRRSILDHGSTFDIAFTGEIRGSVIPVRHRAYDAPRNGHRVHGHVRAHSHTPHVRRGSSSTAKGKVFALVPDSPTEHHVEASAEDAGESDLGTLTQGVTTAFVTRNNSLASLYTSVPVSPINTHHHSLLNLRQAAYDFSDSPARRGHWLDKRQTASAYNLNRRSTVPNRAKSTPASPHLGAHKIGKDLPPLPPLKDLPNLPRGGSTPAGQMLPPTFFKRMMKSDTGHRSDSDSTQTHSSESHGSREEDKGNETTWKTIRRSMSFRRDRSNSRPTLSREPSEREVTVTESPRSIKLGMPLFPRPALSRQSSGIDGAGPPSVSDEDGMGPSTRESGEDDEEENEAGGLRRKKSTRLLHTLKGFTPM